jgi:GTP-binding protein Era
MIALLGAPNAGKSTLLNQLVGSKVAIVTPRVQTTRHQIRGIQMRGQSQLIYIDTPGIFAAKKSYEQTMVANAWDGARDSDIQLLLVDAIKGVNEDVEAILKRLSKSPTRKALLLNKVDRVPKERLLALTAQLNEIFAFDETFMISALKGEGLEPLQDWLAEQLPQGPYLFPEDQISDMPMRFLAAEVTREKLFLRLRQELPYGLTVECEGWEEKKDGSISIRQQIIVERESHKKIILGKQGEQLKQIGQSARMELQRLLDARVHLFLFVKVIPGWKNKKEFMPV